MPARDVARVVVRNVERTAVAVGRAVLAVREVEGEQHQFHARPHAFEQVVHALDVALVDPAGSVVGAAGVEEEQPLGELHRMHHRFQRRVEPDAAARIAGADEVRMAVPDLGRVEAFPRCQHQFVIGHFARKARHARVQQTMLGPVTPGGDPGQPQAGRAGSHQETAAVHAFCSR
jgi:hypothetical protein